MKRKKITAHTPAPAFDPAAVLAAIERGEAVTIEAACKAATWTGKRLELQPAEWTARTTDCVAYGWIV